MKALTVAQRQRLEEIVAAGAEGRVYNGRLYALLGRLEAENLIVVEWFIGGTFSERHRARVLPKGRAAVGAPQ